MSQEFRLVLLYSPIIFILTILFTYLFVVYRMDICDAREGGRRPAGM